jgi:Trypsin-like peptidase domain
VKKHVTAAAIVAAFAVGSMPGIALGAPTWAPASTATVHPGVQTFTDGGQCTANFVFYDGSGNEYIGQAAHCSGTGGNTATNGCTSGSLPTGTPVDVTGASQPGTMVYNSWLTMQSLGETNPDTCAYNDLALVKLAPSDYGKVNPSIPFWGGPTGVGTAAVGDNVYSYGNSELRGGVSTLSPKQGKVLSVDANGWSYQVFTATPGIPGDSGSAFLNATGQAMGVLSTVELAPITGSNGVGNVGNELVYAQAHSGIGGLTLANGTERFNASAMGIRLP